MSVSETSKFRDQVLQYCVGNGLDLGSAGDPVVPTAIQVELPDNYCPLLANTYPPQLRGDACWLYWFNDGVMDFVFSSHLIEDLTPDQQKAALKEWGRVLKSEGYLVILAPERDRWQKALAAGQPPNLAHQHELSVGELRTMLEPNEWEIVEDRLIGDTYSLLFVAKKK